MKDHEDIFGDGINPGVVLSRMLQGFDWAVWVTISIQALGGLVVAVVIKFADNILKVSDMILVYPEFMAYSESYLEIFHCCEQVALVDFFERGPLIFVVI